MLSYSKDDLSMFEPIFGLAGPHGSQHFELHPKELPYRHACFLPGSLYLEDNAFNFFAECFQSASESFDYFSFQRFGEAEIQRLVLELDSFLQSIASEPSRELLFSRYSSIFKSESWSEVETEDLALAVYQCGVKMRSFIESTTQESKCLWVLGL